MDKYNFNAHRVIGMFDSGIGGLNLLKECRQKMPYADFIYFADNYAVPYGNKTREQILSRVVKAFDVMADIGVTAAVVACNTATAVCIDYLRERYSFPIVGIQPAIKQAASSGGRCAVLCTEATARSPSLKKLVERYGNGMVSVCPCPCLARFIEERAPEIPADEVCKLLPDIKADSVVLGCTHYVYIKKAIQNWYGVPVFDGMLGTADHLKTLSGICDHFSKNCGKISFVGGNISKNFEIFEHLMKNSKCSK